MPMLEEKAMVKQVEVVEVVKRGKSKQVARSETPLDKFISLQAAANYEDWTKKKRKIAPRHRFDLLDMRGMEIIPALFHDIGWGSLLIMNELFYLMMLFEFYANLQRGRTQSGGNVVTSRRFEEIFTKGIVLKRSEDRTVDKFDAYGRILHHIISNIVIPNVGHKSSITDMHSFAMLAKHEHRKMNFGYISIEHMLATQSSSTKCLPYGCFLTQVFQHFYILLFRPNEHIRIGGEICARSKGEKMQYAKYWYIVDDYVVDDYVNGPELEPETNEESSVPEPNDPILDDSDDDDDHPKAQAQALRDYQLSRDRGRREIRKTS
ncbi:hypothetical protein M9H77_23859 [Catharanthus roseus]|uniref:Uncharacterized protein n=1 Tax=Catharanthus roseus TaxID=4058 RepID=A0ACC0AV99_CATRO|nr:hypothetical protein M9H77_23859 [Catharanthus roseus]